MCACRLVMPIAVYRSVSSAALQVFLSREVTILTINLLAFLQHLQTEVELTQITSQKVRSALVKEIDIPKWINGGIYLEKHEL